MNKTMKLLAATLFLVGGFASQVGAELSKAGEEAVVEAGRIMFQYRCRSCHSETTDKPSYGPPLKNIIGREAASVTGFSYSDALRNSGIVWDENNLREWIKDNTAFMPGTRMRHVGISDEAEQNFLLSYLKHISK